MLNGNDHHGEHGLTSSAFLMLRDFFEIIEIIVTLAVYECIVYVLIGS